MGLFSRFVFPALGPAANAMRAALIPRCSEIAVATAFALVDIPSQFLCGVTAVRAPRFSALADVLTFLRLSSRRTPKLRLSTSKI
jgi:hypothetical protein